MGDLSAIINTLTKSGNKKVIELPHFSAGASRSVISAELGDMLGEKIYDQNNRQVYAQQDGKLIIIDFPDTKSKTKMEKIIIYSESFTKVVADIAQYLINKDYELGNGMEAYGYD